MIISDYYATYNRLSQKLLRKYAATKQDENTVISPFSVLVLLAIIADATTGSTKDEIIKLICPEIDFEKLMNLLKEVHCELASDGTFTSANGVIIKDSIALSLTRGYESHLRKAFDGKLFVSPDVVNEVNAWVAEKTKGMIDQIADEFMQEMLLCFTNVVTFDAEWKRQYKDNDLINDDFRNSDGTKSRVKMLLSEESEYIENKSFTGFSKPYKNTDYSFVALLPKKEIAITEKVIDAVDVISLFKNRVNDFDVRVKMPEYKISFCDDLTRTFKALGITTAFTPDADFSPISSEWLKAEAIMHKAYIEVDRRGTKAMAVSMVFAGGGSAEMIERKTVQLDRPFIYAIVHNETALPVFMGVVNHLDEISDDEDRMTPMEKKAVCDPIFGRIEKWLLDEDGLIDKSEKPKEHTFFMRACQAYDTLNVEELKKVEEEIQNFLDQP